MSYGPGDISPNDWAFSGGNSFWTNLSTTVYGSGSITRPTTLYCRWGSNTGATITGRSDTWNTGGGLVAYSANYGVSATGYGSYNGGGAAANWWLANASYFGGFWRTASQNSNTPFVDGSGGNYGGQSADDGSIAGYTANWAGVGNPGGLGWVVVSQNTLIYVRRSNAWTQAQAYIRRSAAWATMVAYIRRSAAWTVLNSVEPAPIHETLTKWERHIPESGLAVEAWSPHYGWERAYLVEEPGWFGPTDPTQFAKYGVEDYRKPGIHEMPPLKFTGRYNALDSEELVHERLYAHYRWERAKSEGHFAEAREWERRFLPPQPSEHASHVALAA